MTNPEEPNFEQYQIVSDLLVRQDEVLEELNLLNKRIEAEIKAANAGREEAPELPQQKAA